ncbi:WXG100 family type VII secretion target [Amycolatopsis taiwanensis]|uniref:ESAT-6-like protein n=1 Tax=Amycolatopsis taiwanensis TaxID=342230 RepID=A0A9W6QZC8_9PSEU|nr:WXG100 family type VII secretion target [Amycolatopsis taiwanensis]GLY64817.1 hypothetical protein Atai01_14360 [Amycolatopsis taiwanensis]
MDMPMRYDGTVGDTGSTHSNKAAELMQLFEDLKQQAKSILADDWQGAAADTFDQAQTKWNNEILNLSDAHSTMGRTVVDTMNNAFHADSQAAGLFNV